MLFPLYHFMQSFLYLLFTLTYFPDLILKVIFVLINCSEIPQVFQLICWKLFLVLGKVCGVIPFQGYGIPRHLSFSPRLNNWQNPVSMLSYMWKSDYDFFLTVFLLSGAYMKKRWSTYRETYKASDTQQTLIKRVPFFTYLLLKTGCRFVSLTNTNLRTLDFYFFHFYFISLWYDKYYKIIFCLCA